MYGYEDRKLSVGVDVAIVQFAVISIVGGMIFAVAVSAMRSRA
jgi:hypothetical protein